MYDVSKSVFVSLIAALMIAEFSSHASAQTDQTDAKSDAEQALIEKWKEIYDEYIDSIKLTHSYKNGGSTLSTDTQKLERETLLSFKGDFPVASRHGKVYLWTDKGRPVIIGAISSDAVENMPEARCLGIRFNSLVAGSVTGSRFDEVFWQCDDPGAKWKEGLSDLAPSDSRAIRLSQMKTIVRQFEASTGTNLENPCRLLPQPIYRYPENTAGVTDGAIFSFSHGTDPKAYLQIEAREDRWLLACYRDAGRPVAVRKGDDLLWSFNDVGSQIIFQKEPFYFKYTAERRLVSDPTKIILSNWGRR